VSENNSMSKEAFEEWFKREVPVDPAAAQQQREAGRVLPLPALISDDNDIPGIRISQDVINTSQTMARALGSEPWVKEAPEADRFAFLLANSMVGVRDALRSWGWAGPNGETLTPRGVLNLLSDCFAMSYLQWHDGLHPMEARATLDAIAAGKALVSAVGERICKTPDFPNVENFPFTPSELEGARADSWASFAERHSEEDAAEAQKRIKMAAVLYELGDFTDEDRAELDAFQKSLQEKCDCPKCVARRAGVNVDDEDDGIGGGVPQALEAFVARVFANAEGSKEQAERIMRLQKKARRGVRPQKS
jgi:hypothetical protein